MAIFKAPRITTAQRLPLALQSAEIVYDIDTKSFWGGDEETLGGFPIGGRNGSSSTLFTGTFQLTQEDIDARQITLPSLPVGFVLLDVIGGIVQVHGIDYTVDGLTLSWDGLGLDGFLEVDDTLLVQYSETIAQAGFNIIELTQENIDSKSAQLTATPINPEFTQLTVIGGSNQLYGIDFTVSGNSVSWDGLGLDNFVDVGDILVIQF